MKGVQICWLEPASLYNRCECRWPIDPPANYSKCSVCVAISSEKSRKDCKGLYETQAHRNNRTTSFLFTAMHQFCNFVVLCFGIFAPDNLGASKIRTALISAQSASSSIHRFLTRLVQHEILLCFAFMRPVLQYIVLYLD